MIFASMGDFPRERPDFRVKSGLSKERKGDFHIIVGFSKRKGLIFGLNGDLQSEIG